MLPPFVLMALTSTEYIRAATQRGEYLITDWVWLPLTVLLFVTMRARNGYAALQDLISGTRVIVRPKTQQRPTLAREEGRSPVLVARPDAPQKFGPYEAVGTLWKTADAELVEAFDPVL